jgi:hypothetical protein
MKTKYYVVAAHIFIQLLYTSLVFKELINTGYASHYILTFSLNLAFAMGLHLIITLLIILVYGTIGRNDLVKANLLGIGLAMLIGGSFCLMAPNLI